MAEELTPEERQRVNLALRRIESELHTVIADEGGLGDTVTLDQGAVGRLSRMDAMQQQQMAAATRRRAEQRLARIEAALERLAEDPDEFGTCPECGEPIGVGRLMAVPESVFCVPCLEKR